MFVSYVLNYDLAASRAVPVPACPKCKEPVSMLLDFRTMRVECPLFELTRGILPVGFVQCPSCHTELRKKLWPQEVKEAYDAEKERHRAKFRWRWTLFGKLLLGLILFTIFSPYLYDAVIPKSAEQVETESAYIEQQLLHISPGMRMAVTASYQGKHYRMPVLVQKVEGDIIYARPYKTQGKGYDLDLFFMKNELDLSEQNFVPEATLVLQRRANDPASFKVLYMNGAPAPQLAPYAFVQRVYGNK